MNAIIDYHPTKSIEMTMSTTSTIKTTNKVYFYQNHRHFSSQ